MADRHCLGVHLTLVHSSFVGNTAVGSSAYRTSLPESIKHSCPLSLQHPWFSGLYSTRPQYVTSSSILNRNTNGQNSSEKADICGGIPAGIVTEGKWTRERQNENLVQPDLVRQDQDFYNLILCFNFFTHLNIVELWEKKSPGDNSQSFRAGYIKSTCVFTIRMSFID